MGLSTLEKPLGQSPLQKSTKLELAKIALASSFFLTNFSRCKWYQKVQIAKSFWCALVTTRRVVAPFVFRVVKMAPSGPVACVHVAGACHSS